MTARSTRATAAGTLFLTLAAGVVLGRVWSARLSDAPDPPVVTAPTTAAAAEEAEEDRGRENRRRGLIVERVGLSDGQKAQVDSLVGHSRTMMGQLREDYRSGYRGLIESTRSSIMSVLTPEQAAEYESLLSDFDQRRSRDENRERESVQSRERRPERESDRSPPRDNRERDQREPDRREWSYSY